MGAGIILVGSLVLAVIAFAIFIGVKLRKLRQLRLEMLSQLELTVRSERPIIANGEVDGMWVIYEHHNYRAEPSRKVIPCLRVRVDSPHMDRPNTALFAKDWKVEGGRRPDVRQAPLGDEALDARYDAYADEETTLAQWVKAMTIPVVADTLLHPQNGRVRQITIVDGQVTVVADRFCRMERQRRIIETAVALARGAG